MGFDTIEMNLVYDSDPPSTQPILLIRYILLVRISKKPKNRNTCHICSAHLQRIFQKILFYLFLMFLPHKPASAIYFYAVKSIVRLLNKIINPNQSGCKLPSSASTSTLTLAEVSLSFHSSKATRPPGHPPTHPSRQVVSEWILVLTTSSNK